MLEGMAHPQTQVAVETSVADENMEVITREDCCVRNSILARVLWRAVIAVVKEVHLRKSLGLVFVGNTLGRLFLSTSVSFLRPPPTPPPS